jgi:hypothetical protein
MRPFYLGMCACGLLVAAFISAVGIPPSELKETPSPFDKQLLDWMLPALFAGGIAAVLACGAALIGRRRAAFLLGLACVALFHVAAFGADKVSSRWGASAVTVVLLWPFVLGLYFDQKSSRNPTGAATGSLGNQKRQMDGGA